MSYYYLDNNGITQGPYNIADITALYGTTIHDTTCLWDGRDINVWTPFNQTPQFIKLMGANAIIIWYCSSQCHKKNNNASICFNCKSPTILKIKCLSCEPCFILNDIKAEHCTKCKNKLQLKESVEKVSFRDEIRQNNLFLRGCDNLNTNEENLMLLMYGYVNFEVNDIDLYENIPSDIISICISFAYDINKMNDMDKFDGTQQKGSMRDISNDLVYNSDFTKVTFVSNKKCDSNETANVIGKTLFDSNTIRQVWKIKLTDYDLKESVCLEIGTCNKYGNNIDSVHFVYDTVNIMVNIGDIVCLLLMIDENGKHGKLSFAINGKRINKLTLTVYQMFGVNTDKQRLFISNVKHSMQLQLLH